MPLNHLGRAPVSYVMDKWPRKPRAAADAAGVVLPNGTIGVVITNRRLLIASLGVGATVKELVSSAPIEAVDAIEVKRVGLAATVTVYVRSQPIKFEGRVGPGREFAAALAAARAGTSASG